MQRAIKKKEKKNSVSTSNPVEAGRSATSDLKRHTARARGAERDHLILLLLLFLFFPFPFPFPFHLHHLLKGMVMPSPLHSIPLPDLTKLT